jgi:hypothetical protein
MVNIIPQALANRGTTGAYNDIMYNIGEKF